MLWPGFVESLARLRHRDTKTAVLPAAQAATESDHHVAIAEHVLE